MGKFNKSVARDYTEIPSKDWYLVLKSEIDGIFLPLKSVVPYMRRQIKRPIVIIGLSGVLQFGTLKDMTPDYCHGRVVRSWLTSVL